MLNPYIDDLLLQIEKDGELNYIVTSLVLGYFQPESYDDCEQAIGLLECIKLEFYRRLVSEVENSKIASNGDVYLGGAS
jgi:hypothetical protein